MDVSFVSKDCTPPSGRPVVSGGRLFDMNEEPQGKLLARVALFRQNERLVCICSTDQKVYRNHVADEIRSVISRECEIPINNILLAASHVHSVPDLAPPGGIPDEDQTDFSFVGEYAEKLLEAVNEAKRKLSPLNYWRVADAETECWGINRRPIYLTENASLQVGTQGPRNVEQFVGVDGKDENSLTAYAAYGDEGQLGGFVNYACHPTTRYGSKFYSPDYPGAFYEKMDEESKGCFLFANGPNGNVGPAAGGEAFCRDMGYGLAMNAMDAIERAEQFPAGDLRILSDRLDIPRRKPAPEQLEYAHEFLAKEPNEKEIAAFPYKMYGYEFHFYNISIGICKGLCRQLISLGEEMDDGLVSENVHLQVISVCGDFAFIAVSAEMFNQFKEEIKERSPFKYNCIIQLANGWNGYIPPLESYELGGYECCLSMINRLDKQAHNLIVEKIVNMLTALYSRG